MKVVERYIAKDGTIFELKPSCEYKDKLISLKDQVGNLKVDYNNLVKECSHDELRFIEETTECRIIENEFGESCGQMYPRHKHTCKICGTEFYTELDTGRMTKGWSQTI